MEGRGNIAPKSCGWTCAWKILASHTSNTQITDNPWQLIPPLEGVSVKSHRFWMILVPVPPSLICSIGDVSRENTFSTDLFLDVVPTLGNEISNLLQEIHGAISQSDLGLSGSMSMMATYLNLLVIFVLPLLFCHVSHKLKAWIILRPAFSCYLERVRSSCFHTCVGSSFFPVWLRICETNKTGWSTAKLPHNLAPLQW